MNNHLKRKKKATTIHFANADSSTPGTRQKRGVVNVVAEAEVSAPKVHPDVPRECLEPVFDLFGDDGFDADDDKRPRDARDLDDPLRQWATDHREEFLAEMLRLEGRGDHTQYPRCPRCGKDDAEYRCENCVSGGEMMCSGCVLDAHRLLPFHKVQRWTGATFERTTLKTLELRIQLGHWHGSNRTCPVPITAADNDFVIIDVLGVHKLHLDYCGCGQGGLRTIQLFRAGLWAATTTNPKTAATLTVLKRYHVMSFESKCSVLDFYQALARETDNLNQKRDKERYHEFLMMTKEFRNVQMMKRGGRGHDPGGIANMQPGECALDCPACPHPGKNLPADWESAPEEKQFLYALFLAMDVNFRLKRKDVSTEEKDPELCKGWVFFCEVTKYMEHVKKHWNQKQDRSHCVAHDAVDKPDREACGTASSGIGAVDCARHNMKRPNAIGDLQLGERYLNMDYMFFSSIAGLPLMCFFVSYDIACQWHINLWNRMVGYADDTITIDGVGKFMTFLVPKFHLPAHIEECNLKFLFNLTPEVGRTDGEAPERGWANANPLAGHTKEMGPGARRDTIDDHFNDLNWKKIIALAYTMRRKTETAVPEMRKDKHIAKVCAELAAEAEKREKEKKEMERAVRRNMHITELLGMGIQLEDQQRVLAFNVAGTGLHPTDGQRRAMLERTSKLRQKIFAWIELQTKFFPGLNNVRALEDELWLPSGIAAKTLKDVPVTKDVLMHEYRLRVGQAQEVLHEVQRLLLVRTYTYKAKDTCSRGVAANTRSGEKITALNEQIRRAAAQYWAGRGALVTLGRVLKQKEWEWSLQELREEDIRGLPQSRFGDPDRQKRKKSKRAKMQQLELERPLSWIWISRGEQWEPGDKAAMNKDWWRVRLGRRGLEEGPQLEGETAYALRQAAVQTTLAERCSTVWAHLPDLIRRGREGSLAAVEERMDSDEEDVSDGEEEEPIPRLPRREVKAAYVDEVLEM
ncbi:hypothetical protein DFH07DRAFT_954323 [Mycena maculata]|uniref:CxC2-like cysteine cluster KDZ transposase-associated domain-containing protein n=1 Tax=Mycena maculata TaxID=230809 RepID=A0AAD7JP83_9AGAR|nr:hypothetical protein DFH07DRAFT_954323 [Mycena maculata]